MRFMVSIGHFTLIYHDQKFIICLWVLRKEMRQFIFQSDNSITNYQNFLTSQSSESSGFRRS